MRMRRLIRIFSVRTYQRVRYAERRLNYKADIQREGGRFCQFTQCIGVTIYISNMICSVISNLQMSNREQVIRQRGQTWSTAFKATSLHQTHSTLYTIYILYLRTLFTDVESRAG